MKVLSKKQIFSNYKTYELEDGLTIGQILGQLEFPDEIKCYVDVRINGHKIFPQTWDRCRPNPESVVTVSILPAGGGSNNQLISTIATVAIAYSSGGVANSLFTSSLSRGLFVAGATLVGSQLANAMFPPPEPPKLNGFGVSRLPTVTGQSNRADQYGPVIKNYGRNRVYPRVVAEPFVFYVGNDQYLSAVYDFGIGDNDIQIGKIKIGESSLNDYSGFTYNFAKKPGDFVIYTNSTSIESFSLPFNNEGDNYIRTSPEDSHSIELSFEYPFGLIGIIGRKRISVYIENRVSVKVRPTGTTQWVDFTNYDYDVSSAARGYTFDEQSIFLNITRVVKSSITYRKVTGTFVVVTEWTISHDSDVITYQLNNLSENSQKLRVGDSVKLLGTTTTTRTGATELREARVIEVLPDIDGDTFSARLDTRLTFSTDISSEDPDFAGTSYRVTARSNTFDYVVRNETSAPFRSTLKINFGRSDQWDVWVYFEDSIPEYLGSSPDLRKSFVWNNIIGYSSATPVLSEIEHTYLELKIKATDQLNGRIDNLSAEIVSILDYYDDVNGIWKQKATSNPAWVFADILTGTINQRAISKDDLDVDSLVAWAKYCDENTITYQGNVTGFECNFVLDFETTVKKLLEQVCSTGRASLNINNGKYGVTIDEYRISPTQMFNQRNIVSFSSQRNYSPIPDGIKCTFTDPSSNWQKNEVISYNDGFTASNAKVIEEIDVFACTNIAQAWRQGRYFLAKQKLRQDNVTITVDFESLVCSRGDLVLFSHDVMKNGGDPGRIKAIDGNIITLDIAVASLGGNEVLRVRKRQSDVIEDVSILSFVDVDRVEVDDISNIQVNDLFVFGQQSTATETFLVKSISNLDDLTASLSLVEYNEDIYVSDIGEIPDYTTNTLSSDLTGNRYPGAVDNLSYTYSIDCHDSEKRYIYNTILSWDAPIDGRVDIYEVYVEVNSQQQLAGYSKNNSFKYSVSGLELGIEHTFKVIGVDGFGSKMPIGNASFIKFTPGDDTERPENVSNFNANVLTETIALDWQLTNDCDIDRYYIRFSPKISGAAWGQSTQVTSTGSTQNSVQVPLRTGTYFVKAQDWAGNLSETASFVVTQVPELQNIDFISEINAPVWDGVFANTNTFGDSLTLRSVDGLNSFVDDTGDFFFQEVFDLGDIYTARFESNVLASGFTKNSLMVNWPTLASIGKISGDFNEDDWDVSTYVRARNGVDFMSNWAKLTDVDYMSFGTEATATPWQKFTNADFTGRIFQLRLGLESNDLAISPIVDDVNIIANWTDRIEEGRDDISGNVVLFSNAFVEIPAIQVTSQENTAQGDYYLFTTKNEAGFIVQFYDKDDNAVNDRKFDWIAKGYGKKYNLEDINF